MKMLTLPPIAAAALGSVEPPTKPAEVLRLMIRLFEAPERWTRGDFARDSAGRHTPEYENSACCWCVDGALRLLTDSHPCGFTLVYWNVCGLLRRATRTSNFPAWQDAHTHAEVLAMLREALALAETA